MEEKKENTAPECRKNNDLRTFTIALLTAIIVVALYHFGTGLCKIYCSGCRGYYPTPRYMLVPVMNVPMHGMDEGGMPHRGHGKFGMKKHGFHHGGKKPEWKHGNGFRHGGMKPEWKRGPGFCKGKPGPCAPEAEACKAKPAPAKPAPAPAAAAEKAPAPAK